MNILGNRKASNQDAIGSRLDELERKIDLLLADLPESTDKKERLVHIEDKVNTLLENIPESVLEDRFAKKSWSQYGEDLLIWNKFQELGIERPTYIDVGANHPFDISNTAIFHVHGCHGINIDANPNNMDLFEKYRSNDINICCGIGPAETTMPFYMVDEHSGRNSFVKENVENFIRTSPEPFEIREVRQIRVRLLQDVLDEYNSGKMPDYMSIDIEGMEYDVLSGFDLVSNGPKMLTIEIMDEDGKLTAAMAKFMQDSGYVLLIKAGINHTYVRKELAHSSH